MSVRRLYFGLASSLSLALLPGCYNMKCSACPLHQGALASPKLWPKISLSSPRLSMPDVPVMWKIMATATKYSEWSCWRELLENKQQGCHTTTCSVSRLHVHLQQLQQLGLCIRPWALFFFFLVSIFFLIFMCVSSSNPDNLLKSSRYQTNAQSMERGQNRDKELGQFS